MLYIAFNTGRQMHTSSAMTPVTDNSNVIAVACIMSCFMHSNHVACPLSMIVPNCSIIPLKYNLLPNFVPQTILPTTTHTQEARVSCWLVSGLAYQAFNFAAIRVLDGACHD